jgi:hypothetical protein
MVKQSQYLIDRDPTEQDLKEMQRWVDIHNNEVQRVVRVLNYWIEQPLRCSAASSQ